MPKRTDIKKIMIIGAGPIVIGQACEFDYSGVQACKALKEEGYEIVLVNSNPATIMTDPEMAHRTYIEPITAAVVAKIIERERPDALLPTMGGQTALNTAVALAEMGVLEKFKVELIGAKLPAIKKAEDRELFKKAMESIGLEVPKSGFATNLDQAYDILEKIGFPTILRPAFTLGGTGGGIAYNREEFTELITRGLEASPVRQVLVEESVVGWKEFELEVMRDAKDNVVIVCSIENFDPMGIHTGDSITVAPAQTLTDKEYQLMRDASLKIIREIGVDTGGSNIQFGVNPDNGRMVVIEMNPRVSRSSALASKATGFAIAKIAAKLAVGFTLDEITNDITKATPASFEPTIDYVVTKFPRFAFEKFPQADATLTTQMKSVGEAMAIGRTFKESFQKALRSLEIDRYGLESRRDRDGDVEHGIDEIRQKISVPNWERIWYIADGFRQGMGVDEVFTLSKIDPWFLHQLKQITDLEKELRDEGANILNDSSVSLDHPLRRAKEYGFSDRRLARLFTTTEDAVRKTRYQLGITPVFKTVDTCAAEFEAHTPYLYSTYEKPFYTVGGQGEAECEANPTDRKKVIILGGGPNRIGQGIEFDYCCVHAAFALKEDGYETIMINCNPETVSTDYDTSDRLYFEPLTLEDVLHIIRREKPVGVIVQFGGQTPLKLAVPLEKAGVRILGTTPDSIDRAEDRKRFKELLDNLGLLQAESGTAVSCAFALDAGAIYYNPALMYNIRDQVTASHWFLSDGARYDFIGVVVNNETSAFGLAGTQFNRDNIEARQTITDPGEKTQNSQIAAYGSYAGRIDGLKLTYGLSLKWLSYSMFDKSASGLSSDFGLSKALFNRTYSMGKKLAISAGAIAGNIYQTGVKMDIEKEKLPTSFKGAVSFQTTLWPKYDKDTNKLSYDNLAGEVGIANEDGISNIVTGIQYTLLQQYMLRAGYNRGASVGFGYKFGDLVFDYALMMKEFSNFHRIGFSYSFGGANAVETTMPITDDFQKVYQKAIRVYDRFVRNSDDLIKQGRPQDARMLLLKAIPLNPTNNAAARDLLAVSDKAIANKKTKALVSHANEVLAKDVPAAWGNYIEAYRLSGG